MLFMGTTVQAGRGRGVVVATGSDTEVGKVATLVDEASGGGRAPLQEGLERLGRILSVVVVLLTAGLAVLGAARGACRPTRSSRWPSPWPWRSSPRACRRWRR
jgi:P-type Ca2+ transporter type 2C